MQRQPVRKLALRVLRRVETSAGFADQLIAALAATQGLTPQDRAFLRELTYGVLRWRNRLDWMLQQCSDRLLESLTPAVRNLLRLGAYQLCFMDRLPPYAAVSETVQLAKQVGHVGVVAYVNAVLRAIEKTAEPHCWSGYQKAIDVAAWIISQERIRRRAGIALRPQLGPNRWVRWPNHVGCSRSPTPSKSISVAARP